MTNTYPIDLILVRHGQSEGNLAQHHAKHGDYSYWTEELRKRHTSKYRLTDLGIEQSKITGEWIKENISESFDRYYVSEYLRAKETAAYMNFEEAEWFSEFYLREQDFGTLEVEKDVQNEVDYNRELDRKLIDAFYYAPPGGESIAGCCLRVDVWLENLRKSCSGQRVLAVCHGNILKALRIRLENLRQEDWIKIKNHDRNYVSYNCQVVHYTRRDPNTHKVHRNFEFVRSICPWDLRRSEPNQWVKVVRPKMTNELLLQSVNEVIQLVNSSPEEDLEHLKRKKRCSRRINRLNPTYFIKL
jgi:broad specificity phosphatase PhoE